MTPCSSPCEHVALREAHSSSVPATRDLHKMLTAPRKKICNQLQLSINKVKSLFWCNSFRCSECRMADADWKSELPLVQWLLAHQELCVYGMLNVWMLDKSKLQVLDSICSIPLHFYQINGICSLLWREIPFFLPNLSQFTGSVILPWNW